MMASRWSSIPLADLMPDVEEMTQALQEGIDEDIRAAYETDLAVRVRQQLDLRSEACQGSPEPRIKTGP